MNVFYGKGIESGASCGGKSVSSIRNFLSLERIAKSGFSEESLCYVVQ